MFLHLSHSARARTLARGTNRAGCSELQNDCKVGERRRFAARAVPGELRQHRRGLCLAPRCRPRRPRLPERPRRVWRGVYR